MDARSAADVIGCSVPHVRFLCRTGAIRFSRKPTKNNRAGYEYEIKLSEAQRYRDKDITRGCPRGKRS